MKLNIYNQKAEAKGQKEVSDAIFAVKINSGLINEALVAQMANERQVLAHTKTRSEVRGGGKKPWRQKGTGNARQGSIRAPQWIGGGITFGPRSNRNFSQKVNKKMKQLALAMCLTQLAEAKSLAIFDNLANASAKTKDLNVWLKDLKGKLPELKDKKKFLLVLADKDPNLVKASRNLKNINTIGATSLNCIDLLKSDAVLASEAAIMAINKHYQKIKEKKTKV